MANPNAPSSSVHGVRVFACAKSGRSVWRSSPVTTPHRSRLWHDYGLSITLAVLFLVSLTLQTWMGWNDFVAEQAAHGQVARAFGDDGYVWRWGESVFENWQSEFLQVMRTGSEVA